MFFDHLECPHLLLPHHFTVQIIEVIESDKMEPAMDEIKAKFLNKAELSLPRFLNCLIHRDTNFPGHIFFGIGGKGDHIGGPEILKEFSMKLGVVIPVKKRNRQTSL